MNFRGWLDGLPEERRLALARAYAEDAFAGGAYVTLPDGNRVAIPPILTPLALPRATFSRVSADAHALTSALCKLTADLMRDPAQEAVRQKLFGSFGPLESEALHATWPEAENLATVRVDYLVDPAGRHRALELNATIPAMQGYSDAIAGSFLRAVAAERGLAAEPLIDENGRNTDDLLNSLLQHYARLGGTKKELAIAIVAREGDAQRGELDHYVRRWTQLGHRAFVVTPAEIRLDGQRALANHLEPDLFYRHIFARRLDPECDFARMCLRPSQFRVLNPIASHLEVKAMLGLVSAAIGTEAASRMRLSVGEQDAIVRTVPWTRLLRQGADFGPMRERLDDLAQFTVENGDHLVLKRSWDYGGKGVFLGTELQSPSTQARLRTLLGRQGEISWRALVEHALADKDAWVVQELVAARPEPHLRVEPDGTLGARDLYVDLSAFTNRGVAAHPSGGAVRGSQGRIVNIQGGGGLSPLLSSEVLETLLSDGTS